MTRIDTHIHHLSPVYKDAMDHAGVFNPSPPWSRETTLGFMDHFHIDGAVMAPAPYGTHFDGSGMTPADLARACNEETADLVRSNPTRFAGLAVLPLPDVEASLAELGRVYDDLGLDGVLMLSSVRGLYPGDSQMTPLFEELDRRNSYVFLHPNAFSEAPNPLPQYPAWVVEYPFDTTRAVLNLIYSGTMSAFPGVRIQLAHLGGTAPFLADRIASFGRMTPEALERVPAGVLSQLRAFYYDTGLCNNEFAFAAAERTVGFDRLVFGTDWPYLDMPEGTDPAPGLDFLGPEKRAQLDSAAGALVPRLSAK